MFEGVSTPEAIKEELRNALALKLLEDRGALETDGHFDYGNGFHGTVYLHFHRLLEVPYNIWQLAGDLLGRIDGSVKDDTQVVAGPVTGGAILGAVLATLIDSSRKWTPAHQPVRFAPLHASSAGLSLKCHYQEVVKGRKVLLVDDVRNTGKTFSDASRLLLAAGAKIIATAELYDYGDPLIELGVPNFPGAQFPYKGVRESEAECYLCKLNVPVQRWS